jgi:hypothetical protein
MIKSSFKKFTYFYNFSLFFILSVTVIAVTTLWRNGILDSQKSENLHRLSFLVERLGAGQAVNEINALVVDEKIPLAISRAKMLEVDLEIVNSLSNSNSFAEIKNELQNTKNYFSKLTRYQSAAVITDVLVNKIGKFNDYTKQNSWKTLSSLSEKAKIITQAKVNIKAIPKKNEQLRSLIIQMEEVTSKSYLKIEEKAEISARLQSFNQEMNMLFEISSARNDLVTSLDKIQKQMPIWLQEISPQLTLKKMQLEKTGESYLMASAFIVASILLLFIGGIFYQRWASHKQNEETEASFEELINNYFLASNRLSDKAHSKKFHKFATQASEYIHKRVNFSGFFQESLPFASIMLDENLKVVWWNKQFTVDWNIEEEELAKNYVSWDYLAKMTNLAGSDPLIDAVKNQIAGIFQIQLKKNHTGESIPYEMYVSPVSIAGEKRVSLYFYSLSSFEDTISEQARSLIGPVDKALDYILDDENKIAENSELVQSFNISGTNSIFTKIKNIANQYQVEKSAFNEMIKNQKRQNEILLDAITLIEKNNNEMQEITRKQLNSLKSFKEYLLRLFSNGHTYEAASEDLQVLTAKIGELNQDLLRNMESLYEICTESYVSLPVLDPIRTDLKKYRIDINELRRLLGTEISNLIHFKAKISDKLVFDKFSASFNKITTLFEKLEKASGEASIKTANFEMLVSKLELIFSNIYSVANQISRESLVELSVKMAKDFKDHKEEIRSIESFSKYEDVIISEIKTIYDATRENMRANTEIANLMSEPTKSREETLNRWN